MVVVVVVVVVVFILPSLLPGPMIYLVIRGFHGMKRAEMCRLCIEQKISFLRHV